MLVCYELIRITIKILLMMGVHYKYSRINAVTQINGVISIPRGEFWVSMIESNQPIQLSDRMDTIYHHCRLPANTILQYFHFTQPTTELLLSDPDWGRSLEIQQLFTESLTYYLHHIKITHIYMTKIMWILLFKDISVDKYYIKI